ncbi:MAG: carbohydrate ABC transporter permease [Lachnospiraceae bacterium]|nr:carbohydrate ABC transporter permease [Lachnospiraceae bacterium]
MNTRNKKKRNILLIVIYVLCIIIAVFALAPFLWGLSTSLKNEAEVYSLAPTLFPKKLTWYNYISVFHDRSMMHYFRNSLVVALSSTAVSMVVSLLAAYGFSRYRFPGKTSLLASVLFIRILPRVCLLIPFYMILARAKLINTIPGLVIVYLVVGMPLTIWLLKGYIDAIPIEVEESAFIDGCGPIRSLLYIVTPMVAPALAAVAMFAFITAWNEFMFPLLFAKDETSRTLSVGLAFYIDETGIKWGQMMAASILMSIPAIIVFSYAQKYIVSGLSEGAVKG